MRNKFIGGTDFFINIGFDLKCQWKCQNWKRKKLNINRIQSKLGDMIVTGFRTKLKIGIKAYFISAFIFIHHSGLLIFPYTFFKEIGFFL